MGFLSIGSVSEWANGGGNGPEEFYLTPFNLI